MTETTDAGPLTPAQVRWLKISVVAMGVMIMVGIAILFGRILYLASQSPRSTSTAAVRSGVAYEGSLGLPAGASVRQLSVSSDRLAVHYEGPRGAGIVIIDLTTGARIGRLDLVPEAPR